MDYLMFSLGLVFAYLIGSISTAVWFGKIFYNVDVRQHGSGNAGATNTLRVLGNKPGIIVLLIDAFKGWAAVSLSHLLANGGWSEQELLVFRLLLAFFVVMGHVFPVFTGFKGGKGVATLLGVTIALYPIYLILILMGVFTIIFIATRFVSLGSITVAVLLPVLAYFFFDVSMPLMILAGVIAIIIPVTHKKNIKRLLSGNESRLDVKNNKQSRD
jgi:glycerol-3-phosphate acyltransferase PlsY